MSNFVKALGIAAVGALTAGAVYLSLKSSDASSAESDNKKKSGKKNKRSSIGSTTPTLSLSRTNSASPDLSSPTNSSSSTNSIAKQAAKAFQEKRYQAALQLYHSAILADPTNHKLYINRANVHIFLKDYDSALKDALKSSTISPLNNANAHYTAGRALRLLERFDEALIAFKEARTSGGLTAGIDLLDRIKKMEQECIDAIQKKKAEKLKKEKEMREKEAKELEARERAAAKEREKEKKREEEEKEMEKLMQSATLGDSTVLINSAMLAGYGEEKSDKKSENTHSPPSDAPRPNKNNNPDKTDDEDTEQTQEKVEEKVDETVSESVEMVIANEAATPIELEDPRAHYSPEEERSIAEISTSIVDEAIKFALENTQ